MSTNTPPRTRLDPVKYDPNDSRANPWATYCPRRSPAQFKVHVQRSHAVSALSQHEYGILYEWDSTLKRWAEVINWPDQHLGPPRDCDACGKNMWITSGYSNYSSNQGKTKWVKKSKGADSEPVFICYSCS